MPVPTVVNVGAVASGAAAITPAFPASITTNDILIGIGECEGVTAPGTYTPPSGWAHVTGSPVQQSTNTRLTVIWARYDGVMTAQSWGDSGDHNIGRIIAIRGCPTTGNPWDVVNTSVEAASDTSCTWPGVTTTVADTLVLECLGASCDNASSALGALTNGTYTNIVEQIDNQLITGNGGQIAMVSATKASAGATGSSTATLAIAGFKAFMTLALKEAIPGPTRYRTFVTTQAVPRRSRW